MNNSPSDAWEHLSVEKRQQVMAVLVWMLIHYLAQEQEAEDDRQRAQNTA